jgi:rhodanese-related sulfurtransferase
MSSLILTRCLALFLALAPGAAARHTMEHTKDSLEVVKKNVAAKKAVLVDVRSQEEWNEGHIEGAVFVPINSLRKGGDPKQLAKKLPKKKILYTFCVVGMRAKNAAIALEKHGYTVRPLKPGYEQLLKAGFKKGKKKQGSVKQPEPSTPQVENEDTRQRNAG